MKNLLNSSTSLTLCMALIGPGLVPTFAVAQSGEVAICGNVDEQEVFPCAVEDGTVLEAQETLRTYRNAADAEQLATPTATPQITAEGGEQATAAPAADAAQAEEGESSTETGVQENAAETDAAEKAASDAAAAEKSAVDAAARQAELDAEQAAAAKKAEDKANAAGSAAREQAAEAEAQIAADNAAKQAELEAQLEAEQAAAAEAETAEPEAAAKETEATPQADADPVSKVETVKETQSDAPEQQTDATSDTQAEVQSVDAEAQAALNAEREDARRAEQEAQREATRKALEEEPAGEVITEEVTTEDTRRSDEDFTTTATGTPDVKKDDGLSKLEKALLIGLGAAVVGTVLNNGDRVLSNSGDRVVVQGEGGQLRVLKDDDALLRRPGDEVRTEQFNDGSTRQTVQKPDGSQVVTIRSADGTVLRRISVDANGNETILFDDLAEEREIVINNLPPVVETSQLAADIAEEDLRAALIAQQRAEQDRSFSLRQIREVSQVRALAPPIELDAARFASGSAAIAPEQARSLARVGNTLRQLISDDPRTVFLIEGHTDAVGDATYNLALSDRRAETIALALTEYFDVPPENMITQGYGESALKVQTTEAEQANRRAVVRNITNLLRQASN